MLDINLTYFQELTWRGGWIKLRIVENEEAKLYQDEVFALPFIYLVSFAVLVNLINMAQFLFFLKPCIKVV